MASFYATPAGFVLHRLDGHAVTHPGICSVPYTESIEDWVRSEFPLATYIRRDCDGIAVLDLHAPGMTAVQAPKGSGKSKAIRASMALVRDDVTAVQGTFRRTLAVTSRDLMGPRATLYSDVPGIILALEHPRHTIVINSIARLQGAYDIVIIDELVAVVEALASSLLTGPGRVDAVHALSNLLRTAKTVVVADAMLDAKCVAFILQARLGCCEPMTKSSLTVLDYVRRVHNDYVFYAHENSLTWHRSLNAALEAGKRVVVPCMTKSMANELTMQYSSRFVTQSYSADTDTSLLNEHMTDIHRYWSRVQLLVYSPVVTAGCSFELKHFHVVFFYGFTGLSSVRNAIQMIARVRDIEEKTVHVYIDKSPSFTALEITETSETSETTDATASSMPPKTPTPDCVALMRMLHAYRRAEDYESSYAFARGFWTLVRHSGASIRFVRDDLLPAVPPTVLDAANARIVSVPSFTTAHRQSRKEHWALHSWDCFETGMELYAYDAPVRCHETGQPIVQRVAALNPDHVLDCGLIPPTFVSLEVGEDGGGGGGVLSFPTWCSLQECEPRLRAWCRLVGQKAVWGSDGTLTPDVALPTTKPSTRTTVMYPQACHSARTQKSHVAESALITATRPYFCAKTPATAADALQAAWVLAGMEVAFMYGKPFTAGLLDVMPPSDDLAATIARRVAHVTRYAAWVGINVPMPKNAGVLDYLYMDHDGCYHACTVRVTGDVIANARSDVLKTQALLTCLLRVRVASVRVLYVRADESVVIDTSTYDMTAFRNAVMHRGVPAWPMENTIVYAACSAVGEPLAVYDPLRAPKRFCVASTDEFWNVVGLRRRVVSWNYTLFSDGDTRFDNCVYDMALALQMRLENEHGEDALQIQYAHVVDADVDHFEDSDTSDARRVRDIYVGMVTTGLLIYASPYGKPEGVSLRCVPSVAFMHQYLVK